jgi:hypothetical protein
MAEVIFSWVFKPTRAFQIVPCGEDFLAKVCHDHHSNLSTPSGQRSYAYFHPPE